jgi:predicted esterase
MLSRNVIYPVFIAVLTSCGNHFSPIPPGYITRGEATFKGSNGREIKSSFLFSVPHNYNPKRSFPLIVALHGHGSNSPAFHDLWKSTADTLGYVLLTPQGENRTEEGIGWGENAERSVLIVMDVVQKSVHIDSRKIYLAGFSSGGRLAYFLGLRYANLFHGIAALSSHFDEELVPKNKVMMNKIRVYIGHGSLEQEIAEQSKMAAASLKELGFEVNHVQYVGIGHSLPEPKEVELARILSYLHGK